MEVHIINHMEVRKLLTMEACIDVMRDALTTLARGDAIQPLRSGLRLPQKVGVLGMMPAYMGNPPVMGIKVISVFPGNIGTQYESHQGAVMLFDTSHGKLLAIIDASEITAVRTPAASAVATKILAREDAGDLAILGSGTQAHGHLEAMLLVRPIRRIRVWSLPLDHSRQFSVRESQRHGLTVEHMNTAQDAVEGADIICTTTSAREPILFGNWISDGAHINAVGASNPFSRELDTEAVLKSRMFVDRYESTIKEAGDFLFPKKEGAIKDDHIIGEIGDILLGKIHGRRSKDEITLFKSLGLAIEDVAAAHHIYQLALKKGVGTPVELGGCRGDNAS